MPKNTPDLAAQAEDLSRQLAAFARQVRAERRPQAARASTSPARSRTVAAGATVPDGQPRGRRQQALLACRGIRRVRGMSATEIADELQITAPEAHGLGRTLTAGGWLEEIDGSRPKRWRTPR